MIYIVGISIAFFLSLLLLSKKGKTQADKILTAWLLVIGIHLLLFYLFFSGIAYQHTFWLGLSMPLPLVQGPFLFLYTASLTNQLHRQEKAMAAALYSGSCLLAISDPILYYAGRSKGIYISNTRELAMKLFSW